MDGGVFRQDLPGGLDPVELWHGDVHEDHVGLQFRRHSHSGETVSGRTDNLDSGPSLQQASEAIDEELVVIGKEDPGYSHPSASVGAVKMGIVREIAVPDPGWDSSVMFPPRTSSRSRMLKSPKVMRSQLSVSA